MRRRLRISSRVTWIHVCRVLGVAGLAYEILIDKIDKPTVLIVLGMMVVGAENMKNIFGSGPQ